MKKLFLVTLITLTTLAGQASAFGTSHSGPSRGILGSIVTTNKTR